MTLCVHVLTQSCARVVTVLASHIILLFVGGNLIYDPLVDHKNKIIISIAAQKNNQLALL